MKLGVDVNRHKEVIVKAISAVLLLLLKHFKLNHVYQVPARPPSCPPATAWPCCPPALKTEALAFKHSDSVFQPRPSIPGGKTGETGGPRGRADCLLLVSV